MRLPHSVRIGLLAMTTALTGSIVASPTALAVNPAGVYDLTTDRTAYPAAGTMTATWRQEVPPGADEGFTPQCALTVNGVAQSPIECQSGHAFTFPDSGFRGADTTNSSLTVTAYYSTGGPPQAITATTSIQFDGGIPTAGVSGFQNFDTSTGQAIGPATGSFRPSATYQATLVWNDNLAVTSESCWLERVSPLPAIQLGASCNGPSPSSHGGTPVFTTPGSSGNYNFVVKVTDPAGNTAQASRPFTVDADGPVLTLASGTSDGGSTNAANPSWSWTSNEPATYSCWVGTQGDSPVLTNCTSPVSANALSEGAKQFQIRAVDGLGNVSLTTTNFTVDRTAPTLTLVRPTNGVTIITATPN